jgi:hypothetical protein
MMRCFTLVFLCKLKLQILLDNLTNFGTGGIAVNLGCYLIFIIELDWTLLMMFKVETLSWICTAFSSLKLFFCSFAFNFGQILYNLDIKPINIFVQRHLLYSFGTDVFGRFLKYRRILTSAEYNAASGVPHVRNTTSQ